MRGRERHERRVDGEVRREHDGLLRVRAERGVQEVERVVELGRCLREVRREGVAPRGEHGARGVERRGGPSCCRAQGPAPDLRPHAVQGLRALREHELARRVRRALGACVCRGLGRLRADALRRRLRGRLGTEELVRCVVHLATGPLERLAARLGVVHALQQRVQKEVHQGDALVEGRAGGTGEDLLARGARKDLVDLVVVLVLAEELEVEAEVLRDLPVLQVLGHEVLVDGQTLVAVRDDHAREVLPTARRDHARAVDARAHVVEALGLVREVGGDGGVDAVADGVVHPHVEVGLDVDALQAVHHGGVELARGAVVLRRVAGRDDDPARGQAVLAERLVLQELQHGGHEGLRRAVDLVQEEDALRDAALLDRVVRGGDDLAHGVAADLVRASAVLALRDVRQAERALARVVRDGVADEVDAETVRDLADDGRLADARGTHHDDGALHLRGDAVDPVLVLAEVRADRALDLPGCLLDVHARSLGLATSMVAHGAAAGAGRGRC